MSVILVSISRISIIIRTDVMQESIRTVALFRCHLHSYLLSRTAKIARYGGRK